jgi:hypothetical protein
LVSVTSRRVGGHSGLEANVSPTRDLRIAIHVTIVGMSILHAKIDPLSDDRGIGQCLVSGLREDQPVLSGSDQWRNGPEQATLKLESITFSRRYACRRAGSG